MKTQLFTKLAALALAIGIVAAAIPQLFAPAHAQHVHLAEMSSPAIAQVIIVGKRLSSAEKADFDHAVRAGAGQSQ